MIRAVCICLLMAGPAMAQSDPTITAQRASAMLAAATTALAEADGARDRVAALTDTIRAFEEGLAAVREALRRAEAQEAALAAELAGEREQLAGLLAAMQSIERAPPPVLMLHPAGPLDTARSGIMLSEITPAIAAETATLRARLQALEGSRAMQETARADLAAALEGAQIARAQLSRAIADRTELPDRIETDPQAMQELSAAATSLGALTDALRDAPPGPLPNAQRIDAARGELDLPAFGEVVRGFDEPDGTGIARPGLTLATRPRALVSAPWAGTIRYAGALPGYENVVILEPDGRHLLVLAGLETLYVTTGEIAARAAPLGLMGGLSQTSEDLIVTITEDAGLSLSETLYIEFRIEDQPVDPAPWFRLTRDDAR